MEDRHAVRRVTQRLTDLAVKAFSHICLRRIVQAAGEEHQPLVPQLRDVVREKVQSLELARVHRAAQHNRVVRLRLRELCVGRLLHQRVQRLRDALRIALRGAVLSRVEHERAAGLALLLSAEKGFHPLFLRRLLILPDGISIPQTCASEKPQKLCG